MVFISLTFLLLYKIGRFVFKDKLYPIFFSIAIVTQMIYKDLLLMIVYVISLISKSSAGVILGLMGRDFTNLVVHSPLIFDRVTRPSITFFFVALAIIFLLKVLIRKDLTLKKMALYGLSWSFLFYSYFYNFVVFFFTVGLLGIFYLFKDRNVFKNLVITSAFATLFSIPYWINYFRFRGSDFYLDYVTRVGTEMGHFFRFIGDYYLWAFVLILFLILRKYFKKEWVYFCVAFFFAGIMGLNLQLITGYTPQPDHFMRVTLFAVEFMMLSILYVIVSSFDKTKLRKVFNKKTITYALIIIILLLSLAWQVKYFNTMSPLFVMDEGEIGVYEWLNENVKETSVIVSDDLALNQNAILYTGHDIFLAGGGPFTISTNEDLLDRAFVTLAMLDYSKEEAEGMLVNEWHTKEIPKNETTVYRAKDIIDTGLLNYIYMDRMPERDYGLVLKGFVDRNWSYNQRDIDNYLESYLEVLENRDSISVDRKADYIVTQRDLGNGRVFSNLYIGKVYSNDKYTIYKIEKLVV